MRLVLFIHLCCHLHEFRKLVYYLQVQVNLIHEFLKERISFRGSFWVRVILLVIVPHFDRRSQIKCLFLILRDLSVERLIIKNFPFRPFLLIFYIFLYWRLYLLYARRWVFQSPRTLFVMNTWVYYRTYSTLIKIDPAHVTIINRRPFYFWRFYLFMSILTNFPF